MNRLLAPIYPCAFAAGLATIGWTAATALQHHPLAVAMTLLIAAFFTLGAWELRRFRQNTAALAGALDTLSTPPATLELWLATVPEPLRDALRQRADGARTGLPGVALAPSLAGLLVLLGMLGTFLGLVATLGGTAAALRATADLDAMRSALTAPVQGLGLAFGTSVAGVASSAMLGLMVALARRERAAVARRLDTALATVLRPFTAVHRREAAQTSVQQALEVQAHALPGLVAQLHTLTTQMVQQQAQFQSTFQAQWLAEQARFHAETKAIYTDLAGSVASSLHTSLVDSAREAGAVIQPAVQATMAGLAREASAMHQQVTAAATQQLQALGERFEAGAEQTRAAVQAMAEQARQTLAQSDERAQNAQAALEARSDDRLAKLCQQSEQQLRTLADGFTQQSGALVHALGEAHATQQSAWAEGDTQRLSAWREALASTASGLQQDWAQASSRILAEQQQLSNTLAATAREVVAQAELQARTTIGEVSALLQSAAEAPRAAAEVVGALREQLSKSLAQDNAALAERAELMQTLHELLDASRHAATEQRSAIDALVASSREQLDSLGQRFAQQVDATSTTVAQASTQLAASALEMGSLGEGFGAAVEQFHGSNQHLGQHLGQLEAALARTMTRSDEQLAYTVAQARELIDLCVMSQKQVLDELRALASGAARPHRAEAQHG